MDFSRPRCNLQIELFSLSLSSLSLFPSLSPSLNHCTGTTPLRHLVYRVLELPASMKPLVYDYGGLNADTEEVYIRRIVDNHVSNDYTIYME